MRHPHIRAVDASRINRCLVICCALLFTCSLPQRLHGESVFAVIGDWGSAVPGATAVANMVTDTNWNVDYILTVGDNNYGNASLGSADWDAILGARYGDFMKQRVGPSINPYPAQTSAVQRFFPTIGNHDVAFDGTIAGYLDYFHTDPDNLDGRLPAGVHDNTQSYYDVELPIDGGTGSVHLFAMDSERFRIDPDSRVAQEAWLRQGLEESTATWKFVFFHHASYSSGPHGSDPIMQLPFQQWGAHAVFTGHDHTYERLRITDSTQNAMLYFVNGIGGQGAYSFNSPIPGSESRYSSSFGAMRVTATDETATFEFLSIDDGSQGLAGGQLIDTFTLSQSSLPALPPYADFDDDGFVTFSDLAYWESAYGLDDSADADGDGDSDGIDFLIWQSQVVANFGGLTATLHVPEPALALPWLGLAAGLVFRGRIRTRITY